MEYETRLMATEPVALSNTDITIQFQKPAKEDLYRAGCPKTPEPMGILIIFLIVTC
jgi:hypothetical protein